MSDWSDPNGLQLQALQEALLSAFPNPPDLEQLLAFKLDQSYVQITAGSANYRTAVFQVLMEAKAAGWLPALVAAVVKERPNNPKVKLLVRAYTLAAVPAPAGRSIEDIVRSDGGFQDALLWLGQMDRVMGQVCRVEHPVNQGVGTGWLVGSDLMLTNWHVVRGILAGTRKAADYACRFDYAAGPAGVGNGTVVKLAEKWLEASSPASPLELGEGDGDASEDHLDFALLRLASAVGNQPGPDAKTRGWIATARGTAMPPDDSILFVAQHESGNPLKLSMGSAKGANAGGTRLLHTANTLRGSSGSPCLNARVELVALHNSGDPLYDGAIGQPKTNRAVPIEPILARLDACHAPRFWA
jgi:hypothetical protein